ncbi:MAG: hypothetical protein AB8B97_20790 [Granulosicoccus sp.]
MQTELAHDSSDALTALLDADIVPLPVLHERYGALLKLVKVLIGVVPNCDTYLEIWPPAFRTYNIIVPNFLNLPFGIFGIGGAPKDIVGLGIYVASRSAECPYCSAHTCSFAMRRGATPEKVANALLGGGNFTQKELATIAVARSLARIPCELSSSEKADLLECFTPSEAEWVVLGVVMMGFLNKFMDAIGVDLEASTVAETQAIMGAEWSPGKAGRRLDDAGHSTAPPVADGIFTKLSVLRYAPTALRLDKQWQQGVPDSWPAVGTYLQGLTGHDFPVLSRMHNARGIRAVASALRENLNAKTSMLGLDVKAMAGVVFASIIGDEHLANDVRIIALRHGLSVEQLDALKRFAQQDDAMPPANDVMVRAILLLTKAASPSPAEINSDVVSACRVNKLSSPAIVELITWLSVLQMLHRLSCFYTVE